MAEVVSILGSTGSIGTQAVDVIKRLDGIKVCALTTNVRTDMLEKQIRELKPAVAAVMNEKKAKELKESVKDTNTRILCGMEGLIEAAVMKESDTVLNSVVGNIGLEPTMEAIKAGKNIALANKETLVTSGELVMKELNKRGLKMYPVDSEHSAIFQSLQGNEGNKIRKIYLTASGGPFRERENLEGITLEDALKHPNWNMGKKITIDSATLMNKGLEVIEAKWLFGVELEQIEVVVHPQSVIHSMVEYEDSAVIAQLGEPDMRVPIQYALTYPKRVMTNLPRINFFEKSSLTFEKPKRDLFPCLNLAYKAITIGGTMPAVLNAANETAVGKFIEKKIGFTDIPKLIEKTMDSYNVIYNYTLEDVLKADKWARAFAGETEVE